MGKCDACYNNPCQHEGTCEQVAFQEFECTCEPGFHGDQCQYDIDACFGNPCENGGACKVIDDYGRFK